MNEYLLTIILGIVQGITEFLPISSDGHLEIAKYFLGDQSKGLESLELTVLLHIGTTLSIFFVFRRNIIELLVDLILAKKEALKYAGLIAVSMIPAGIVGLFFEKEVSQLFSGNIALVAVLLFINGIVLYFGNKATVTDQPITYTKSFVLGIAQMLAILPGISRSGTTISTAAFMKINRYQATEFSFIMLLPLMLGKIVKDIFDGSFSNIQYSTGALSAGFFTAFVVGIFAFQLLLKLVKQIKLQYFAYYCMIIGIVLLVYYFQK